MVFILCFRFQLPRPVWTQQLVTVQQRFLPLVSLKVMNAKQMKIVMVQYTHAREANATLSLARVETVISRIGFLALLANSAIQTLINQTIAILEASKIL